MNVFLKLLNQNFFVITSIFVLLSISAFLIAFYNHNPLQWIIFLFVDVMMIRVTSYLIKFKSLNIIHQGPTKSNLYLFSFFLFMLIYGAYDFINLDYRQLKSAFNFLSTLLMFFSVILDRAVTPSVVIAKEGVLLGGAIHQWKNLEMMKVQIIDEDIVKISPMHLPTFFFPAVKTDKTTCDIFISELQKHGYSG